jgi:nuclear GTP-binding protein
MLDLTAAARLVLRDWAIGRLPRSAMPPKADSSTAEDLHVDDERTLANVPTRVECRKASGIVRMTAGSEETREPEWEAPWVRVAAPREDAEDDAEGDQDMEDVEDDVSSGTNADEETEVEEELDTEGEPDESDEDEEEEEAPPPVKRKRKADVAPPTAPAPKKVAFSKTPKGPSVQATDFAAPKSVLKVKSAKETTKPKPSVTQARRKLAAAKSDGAKKAPTKGKSTKAQTAGSKEGGAYEFGEFF